MVSYHVEWGIVLHAQPLGESKVKLHIFSKEYGVISGLIRKTVKKNFALEKGSIVQGVWRAKLEEHIGFWNHLEPLDSSHFFHLLKAPDKAAALSFLLQTCTSLISHKVVFPTTFQGLFFLLHEMHQSFWPHLYLGVLLSLLKDSGYGIEPFWPITDYGFSSSNISCLPFQHLCGVCQNISKQEFFKIFHMAGKRFQNCLENERKRVGTSFTSGMVEKILAKHL